MINYLNDRGVPPAAGKVSTAGTMQGSSQRVATEPGTRTTLSLDAAKARQSRAGLGERSCFG
jgi:hypothetical protein